MPVLLVIHHVWRFLLKRGEAERKRSSRSAVVVAAAAEAACGGIGHETLADGPC